MSDKTYEMIGSDGEQYGPFTLQELQETISQGRADTQTQIRETGTEAWQPLGQLLGSQSIFNAFIESNAHGQNLLHTDFTVFGHYTLFHLADH